MSTATATMGLVKPDTNDKTEDTIRDLADNFERLDKAASWVGMIIQSSRQIVPSEIYGGTWTPLQGRMLVGAGADFPAGTTGGAREVALKGENNGPHAHRLALEYGNTPNVDMKPGGQYSQVANFAQMLECGMEESGSGTAHENMPPYRAVYMWERTA